MPFSVPLPVVHASLGTVSTDIESRTNALNMLGGDQEFVFTGQTCTFFGKLSDPFGDNQELSFKPFVPSSNEIAALTRGREIIRGIVGLVPIEMIRDQRTSLGPAAGHPGHQIAAAMAGMRSRTDLVPEDEAMFRYGAARGADRMIFLLDVLVRTGGHADMVHHGVST
jgi:hypothetical protein